MTEVTEWQARCHGAVGPSGTCHLTAVGAPENLPAGVFRANGNPATVSLWDSFWTYIYKVWIAGIEMSLSDLISCVWQ